MGYTHYSYHIFINYYIILSMINRTHKVGTHIYQFFRNFRVYFLYVI